MKKRRLFGHATPLCPSAYDELMMKYTAVCEVRDRLKAELTKALERERKLVVENIALKKTIKQIRELVKKYDAEGGAL